VNPMMSSRNVPAGMPRSGPLDRPTLSLVLLLTLLSTTFVTTRIILPYAAKRIEFANSILANQAEPHYQYRVVEPLLGEAVGRVIGLVVHAPVPQHILAYTLIAAVIFFVLFATFALFLRRLFSDKAVLVGLLLLQAVIPLTVTGFYMEGDFMTTAFYSCGLLAMVSGNEVFLPAIMAVSTLNREQMIFLAIIYAIWIFSQRRINRRTLSVLSASIVAWVVVMVGIRMVLGFRQSQYTMSLNIATNTEADNLFKLIAPIWLGEVGGFVLLCASVFRRSHRYFQLTFLTVFLYGTLFFFNAFLWETAKFLPAFLLLIPMALQGLVGEFPVEIPAPPERRQPQPALVEAPVQPKPLARASDGMSA